MKIKMVECCATCKSRAGWLDNMWCKKHGTEELPMGVQPYYLCEDYEKNEFFILAAEPRGRVWEGVCDNCGDELNNVTTGVVVIWRGANQLTVCGRCGDALTTGAGYTFVAQAKSLFAEPNEAALLRDATEGRR